MFFSVNSDSFIEPIVSKGFVGRCNNSILKEITLSHGKNYMTSFQCNISSLHCMFLNYTYTHVYIFICISASVSLLRERSVTGVEWVIAWSIVFSGLLYLRIYDFLRLSNYVHGSATMKWLLDINKCYTDTLLRSRGEQVVRPEDE